MSQPSDATSSPKADDQTKEAKINPRKVYVGNLSFGTKAKGLKEAFSTVGEIDKMHLAYKNGKRLGFAFVQFKTEEAATNAIEKLNGTELDGREIKVEVSRFRTVQKRTPKKPKAKATKAQAEKKESKPAEAKQAPAKKKKRVIRKRIPLEEREESEDSVFVRGFGEDVDKDAVTELFKNFGVTGVALKRSVRFKAKERIVTRYAFVTVDSAANQNKAVDELNGKELKGEKIEVLKAFKAVPPQVIEEEVEEKKPEAAKPKSKKNRKRKPKQATNSEQSTENAESKSTDNSEAAAKPKKKRAPRKPKKTEGEAAKEGEKPAE